jgi:RNA polymerase sigma-70 factor, ECF subfamily
MRAEIEKAVQLLQSKDAKALEQAIALLQNTVFSFSMKVCGQREDAEDTMQEVLIKSVRFLPQFDDSRALAVWLYKVARSRCLMSRRTSKFAPKEKLSLENLIPDRGELVALSTGHANSPERSFLRGEKTKRLQGIVRKLLPEYRLVLVLHDMEGLSDKEIAEIMHLRPGTVRVRLHRARLFVRKELAKKNGQAGSARPHRTAKSENASPHRPGRCKEMFAELSDYLDDALDDSLCEELEKHMRGCQPCQGFLSSLEETVRGCRETPEITPSPRKTAEVRKVLLSKLQKAVAGSA